MRRVSFLGAGLLWLIATCPPARAGLYLPLSADPWPLPASPEGYRKLLLDDRQAANNPAAPYSQRLRKQVKDLEARKKEELTVPDLVSLGGYLILLNQYDRALAALTEAQTREPENFMVLANLATLYFVQGTAASDQGLLQRALNFQEQLLSRKTWPRKVPGWSTDRLRFQRRAERLYLSLIQQRYRDSLQRPPGGGASKKMMLDDLFPGVRFVDPGGKFVPGEMDLRMQDRLPPDALALVQQLLLWLPQERPLWWLYAELLNAYGHVEDAKTWFHKLVFVEGWDGEGLREHSQIIKAAPAPPPEKMETPGVDSEASDKDQPKAQPAGGNDSADKTASWLPDWRALGVGFGSGLLVGILLLFQLRLIFRRH